MKDKLELIDLAFGRGEVLADFEKWCDEKIDTNSQYPVTEYLRMIDARLGGTPKIDPDDARIKELMAVTYELTAILPHLRAVRDLLAIHSLDEIKAALRQYVLTVDEKDMKSAIRSFYDDLGASAVIYSMKKGSLK
jgi:acyl transferase domain-containing protein